MIYEEKGPRGNAIVNLHFSDQIAEISSMVNEPGILAMTFMSRKRGKKNWTWKFQEYLDHQSNGGMTRVGTEFKDKFVIENPSLRKSLPGFITTDGVVCPSRKGSKAI